MNGKNQDGEPWLEGARILDGQGAVISVWAAYLWQHLLEKEMNTFKPLLLSVLSFIAKNSPNNVRYIVE